MKNMLELQQIALLNVRKFGYEIREVKNKDGSFRKFEGFPWISYLDEERLYVKDIGFNELKRNFKNYTVFKRPLFKDKKGKQKKATEWICTVERENVLPLNATKIPEIEKAMEMHTLYEHTQSHLFFLIYKNVFRDNKTDEYCFYDPDRKALISTGLKNVYGESKVTKEDIDNYIKKYFQNKKKKEIA